MTILALALSAFVACSPGAGSGPAAVQPDVAVQAGSPEAERLYQEAYTLFGERRSWEKAARLFERSAELRSADDPKRANAYSLAARLYVHVRELDDAQRMFVAAAEAATDRGAVAEAAHAYLDAATVAAMRGEQRDARSWIEKGELLSHSPHLDGGERTAIRDRIPTEALASL